MPPLSLPVLRPGLEQLHRLVVDHVGSSGPVFAIEATGGLHQVWVRELNQRFPGSVRLFAPSETTAARTQLGSRRFKTDDRDCAALTVQALVARQTMRNTICNSSGAVWVIATTRSRAISSSSSMP